MLDQTYSIGLSIECPMCNREQGLPVVDAHTGVGFLCPCGEEFPISVAAMAPVQRELEEVRHLVEKTIVLPL